MLLQSLGGASASGFRVALFEASEDLKPTRLLHESTVGTTRRYRYAIDPVIRLEPGRGSIYCAGAVFRFPELIQRVSAFLRDDLLQNNPIISWMSMVIFGTEHQRAPHQAF